MFSCVLTSKNIIKRLWWGLLFEIRGFCTTGDTFPCFCSFYPAGHLNASQSKTKIAEIHIKSIQNTFNIKGARLQKGAADCTRVTSAQSPASLRAAVLGSADRGHSNRHWEDVADDGICSGSVCFPELWLMGLIPLLHCEACGSFVLWNNGKKIQSYIAEQAQKATG